MIRAGAGLLLGFLVLLAPASAVAVRGSRSPGPAGGAGHDVDIRAFRFQPEMIDVGPGDTVTWTNQDMVPHAVSADDGTWSSGTLGPGDSWSLVVPPADSTGYLCDLHPSMTGALTITAPAPAPTRRSPRP